MVSKWVPTQSGNRLSSRSFALMLSSPHSSRCSQSFATSSYKLEIYYSSNRNTSNEIRGVREDLTPLRHKIRLTINYMSRVTAFASANMQCLCCSLRLSLSLTLTLALCSALIVYRSFLAPLMLLLMGSTGTGTERGFNMQNIRHRERALSKFTKFTAWHIHTHTRWGKHYQQQEQQQRITLK